MGYKSSRKRSKDDDSDTDDGDVDSGRKRDDNEGQTSSRVARSESDVSIQRSTKRASGRSERQENGGSISGYVECERGPDRQALSERYNMDVRREAVGKLQRLQSEFGSDKVSRWAEEGMPVETMGKPRDMQAFRERQEGRSEAVPTDIERRNAASAQRNAARNREAGPAGETGVPDVVRSVVSTPGHSMDETVQREMEAKMGGDFSDVQIHSGPKATAAAESINARAFTVGNHVAFNKGEYQPDSERGKKVLAHELTHVRQQTEGCVSLLSKVEAEHPGTSMDVGGGVHVQPKLEVSSPNDPAEREAERVAEAVVEMDVSSVQARASGEKPLAQEKPHPIVTSSESATQAGKSGHISKEIESTVRNGVRGGGKPLPAETRSKFESKMGADFSDVRVHTDSEADEAARSINAEAYTMGSDIGFADGFFNPKSQSGKQLLAHELTHVTQQNSAASKSQTSVQRKETITFEEGEGSRVHGDTDTESSKEPETKGESDIVRDEMKSAMSKYKDYLSELRDSIQSGINSFSDRIFNDSSEETKPDILGAALETTVDIVKNQITDRIPLAEEFMNYVENINKELQKAKRASTVVQAVDFVNTQRSKWVNGINDITKKLRNDKYKRKQIDKALDSDDPLGYAVRTAVWADNLPAPKVEEFQKQITLEYIRQREEVGVDLFRAKTQTGALKIVWNINEESDEVDTEPDQVILGSPKAGNLKDSLGDVMDSFNAGELPIKRVLEINSEQKPVADIYHLYPDDTSPGSGLFGLYHEYIQEMPTIWINQIQTSSSVYI